MGSFGPEIIDIDPVATLSLQGTFTAGTWYNTVITRGSLAQGIYIVHVYADTSSAGASQYTCRSASVPLYWSTGTSNTTSRTIINNEQAFMGHAPNTYLQWNSFMALGIKHVYSSGSGDGNQILQVQFASTMTLDGASSKNCTLYFERHS